MSEAIKKEVFEWIKTIVIAVAIALIISQFVRPTLVRGVSMYPTLDQNDYLLIYRRAYSGEKAPEPGDIVVFKSHLMQENGDNKDLVKRIIGVQGDHILIHDGLLFINGDLQEEKYTNGAAVRDTDFVDEVIPEGYYFAMGDNRLNSADSREPQVGMVQEDDIIGKVFLRLFPFNKINTF